MRKTCKPEIHEPRRLSTTKIELVDPLSAGTQLKYPQMPLTYIHMCVCVCVVYGAPGTHAGGLLDGFKEQRANLVCREVEE